jgi:hypothetical protein
MSKKELLAKLLAKLSEEELEALVAEDESEPVEEQPTHTHTINSRRGSGHSKKKRNTQVEKQETRKKKKKRKNGRRISKGKACRTSSMDVDRKRPNQFEQFIKDANLDSGEKKELAAAAKIDKAQRGQRTRFKLPSRKNNLVDVDCCVCGDEYTVSASIVHDVRRWKCNDCSCQAGY